MLTEIHSFLLPLHKIVPKLQLCKNGLEFLFHSLIFCLRVCICIIYIIITTTMSDAIYFLNCTECIYMHEMTTDVIAIPAAQG